MSTCVSPLHKLSLSFDLYAQSTLSRVKTQSYFNEQPVYRCEVQEMRRPILSKSSTLFFIYITRTL